MKRIAIIAVMLLGLLPWQASYGAQRTLAVKSADAQLQKRVALVMGNASYKGAPALRNPVNDANAISASLNNLGFEVIEVTNATQKEMNRAITVFGSKLTPETVALFFYAGHGIQSRGKNYIIPVDAQISSETSIASEGVSIETVLEQLNNSSVSIVILDACRNNPFERSFRKMGGGGLAQMDAPKGSFIAYATAPGKTAADGDGRNGLFTQELLKQINEPGLDIENVFKRVRANVAEKSGDAQLPWDSSSMTGEFYFRPGPARLAINPSYHLPEEQAVTPHTPQTNEPIQPPNVVEGPTFEETMKFVLEKVNVLLGSKVVVKHNNPKERSQSTSVHTNTTVPAQSEVNCTISRGTLNLNFGDIRKVVVQSYQESFAQDLIKDGDLDSVITQVSPQYYYVSIKLKPEKEFMTRITVSRQTDNRAPVESFKDVKVEGMDFLVEDRETAERVAKAFNHTLELCGGGESSAF